MPPKTVSIARNIREQARERAHLAWRQLLVIFPLSVATILVYHYRMELFGIDAPVRVVTGVLLLILGWELAKDVGRVIGPSLFKRTDPGTAGTLGFSIRLFAMCIMAFIALKIAGLTTGTVAVGGAITAVIFGLASQQTLGNLIAGTVLLSAQPFRVGDRIRLQGGPLAGELEGTVTSLGLLYTTLSQGEDRVMVPNSAVLSSAVTPLKEPAAVDLIAKLKLGVKPSQVQELLDQGIDTPTREAPHIELEKVDEDGVLVRVTAAPASEDQGSVLADEILEIISEVTPGENQEFNTGEFEALRSRL